MCLDSFILSIIIQIIQFSPWMCQYGVKSPLLSLLPTASTKLYQSDQNVKYIMVMSAQIIQCTGKWSIT